MKEIKNDKEYLCKHCDMVITSEKKTRAHLKTTNHILI